MSKEISNSPMTSGDKSVDQVSQLSDNIPCVSKEKENKISFNTKNYFPSNISDYDKELTCAPELIFANCPSKCTSQEVNKFDGISLLPQENSVNFLNGEENPDAGSIAKGTDLNIDVHHNVRSTNSELQEGLVNLNDENQVGELNNSSLLAEENSENLFNNVHMNADGDSSSESDVHQDESSESQEILGLPVNLYHRSCDQQGSLDDHMKSIRTDDSYKNVFIKNALSCVDGCEKSSMSDNFATQGLANGISVRHHTTNQMNRKKYACDVCTKKFKFKSTLVQHTRVHTGERPFACSLCEKKFRDKKTMTRHIRTHTGTKTFVCEICNKAFLEKKNLMQHVFIHTGERPYACEVCQKRFKVRRDLNIHFTTHSDEKPFSCELCEKRFHSKNALKKHHRVHYPPKVEKTFVCGVCLKAFKNSSSLSDHLIVHTGEKPHVCKVCQSSFTRKSSLNRHFLRHTGERPYACDICLKVFPLKYHLKQHKRTHSDEKPFVCEVCNSAFRNVGALNMHFATHTGGRPHVCHICQSAFTRKSSLSRHLQKHCSGSLASAPENGSCDVSPETDINVVSAEVTH